MRQRPSTLLYLGFLCSLPLPAAAAVNAGEDAMSAMCRPALQAPARILDTWEELDQRELLAPAAPVPKPPVVAEADRAAFLREGVSQLEGDVWLQQGESFISTERLEFDESSGMVRTLAPARFGSRQLLLDAAAASYDTSIGEGLFEDVEFYLPTRGGRGSADELARTGELTLELDSVKYTTCAPEDEDWTLKASSLDLDHGTGRGVGRNVRLAFMGVPFFYTPWISFPIDERRQTGFLFPEFGDSGRTGPWLRLPYYLNLAPNYDATLTPYYMEDRGTAMNGEFRYLFGWGVGEVNAEYLAEDEVTQTNRYHYRLDHLSLLPANWRVQVNYRQVSDESYFQDFSSSGRGSLLSHVAQQVSLQKSELEYGAQLQLLRYQTVDPTLPESSRPYEQWPAVKYYYTPLAFAGRYWLEVEGESVNFQRKDRVSGWRHHTVTALSTDIGDPGLQLTPRLAWWRTEYDLEQSDSTALEIQRSLPVTSIDLRSRLSRPFGSGTQTLEPRLYYVHIPWREQDDIPLFDTNLGSDSLASLFRPNRFTGVDRIGDDERVSLGVDSALLDADGREWLRGGAARAWYLEDRRVQRSSTGLPETATASNYYGALEYLPRSAQKFRLDLSWDPDSERFDSGAVQYQFHPADRTVFNLAYRYRREPASSTIVGPLEQVDTSFAAPLGGRWSVFGRAVYSLPDSRSQEILAGFEYETCCWVFRSFNRRFIYNHEGEFDQSVWFQLELKGLSSVGRRIDEFLADDIYGYGDIQ